MVLNTRNTPINNLFPRSVAVDSKSIVDFFHEIVGCRNSRYEAAMIQRKQKRARNGNKVPPVRGPANVLVYYKKVQASPTAVQVALHNAKSKWHLYDDSSYWNRDRTKKQVEEYKYINVAIERSSLPAESLLPVPRFIKSQVSHSRKTFKNAESETKSPVKSFHLADLNHTFNGPFTAPRPSTQLPETPSSGQSPNPTRRLSRPRWFDRRERLVLKKHEEIGPPRSRIEIEQPLLDNFNVTVGQNATAKRMLCKGQKIGQKRRSLFKYRSSKEEKAPEVREKCNVRKSQNYMEKNVDTLEAFSASSSLEEEIRELAKQLDKKKKRVNYTAMLKSTKLRIRHPQDIGAQKKRKEDKK